MKDTKTLSLDFGEGESEKLKEELRQLGELVAYSESTLQNLSEWTKDWMGSVDETLQKNEAWLNDRLERIQSALDSFDRFDNMFTAAGAARYRQLAEQTYHQSKTYIQALDDLGKSHLASIQNATQSFHEMAEKTFARVERTTQYALKKWTKTTHDFSLADFQGMTHASCKTIEATSQKNIAKVGNFMRRLYWTNLAFGVALTFIVSVTIGLYLNDEMPWETHKRVVMQRDAGRALMHAWPTLSQVEQQRIMSHSQDTG